MAKSTDMQQPSAANRDVEEAYAKQDMEFVESAADPTAAESERLSKPHRDYLMERHGTLNLDPIPAMDPADPYNWPEWKVRSPVTLKKISDWCSSRQLTDKMPILTAENYELDPSRLPRMHGYICGSRYHPSILRHSRDIWCLQSASELSDFPTNCRPWRRATLLETSRTPFWSPPYIFNFINLQSRLQCGLCEEYYLRCDRSLQSSFGVLYRPCICYWKCCCDGDNF